MEREYTRLADNFKAHGGLADDKGLAVLHNKTGLDANDDILSWIEALPDWERDGPRPPGPSQSPKSFSPAPTRQCLRALGLVDAPWPVLQVVGSKGKGTTATIAASLLSVHGLRIGLYQSPHPLGRLARISIDGDAISRADYLSSMSRLRALSEASGLSRFELETAAACLYFSEKSVDAVVLEAGLGGVGDATSLWPATVVCLTSIELEHTAVLGDSHAAIALQKAGILASGATIVSGVLSVEADEVVERLAHERDASWYSLPKELVFRGVRPHESGTSAQLTRGTTSWSVEVPMLGRPAVQMVALACLAVEAFLHALEPAWSPDLVQDALDLVGPRLPARLQLLPIPDAKILLDGAHTPSSVAHAVRSCREHFGQKDVTKAPLTPYCIMLALNRDKAIGPLLHALGHVLGDAIGQTRLLLVPNPGPRGASASELLTWLRDDAQWGSVMPFSSWEEGWELMLSWGREEKGVGLVLGSFQLAGAILQAIDGTLSP